MNVSVAVTIQVFAFFISFFEVNFAYIQALFIEFLVILSLSINQDDLEFSTVHSVIKFFFQLY